MTGWPKAPDNRKTVRIEPELWRELKAEAVKQDMTIGEFIKLLLKDWMSRKLRKGGDKR